MTRSLIFVLLAALLGGPPLAAQVLDQTMVPRGQFRMQAHPRFMSWDSRFDAGGNRKDLGDDLTDPTTLSLFPGIATLSDLIGGITATSGYTPILGSTQGRVTQEINQVDFGGHFGVFDWLTVGVVVPWANSRTALDVAFVPDTLNGDLGLNPTITNGAGVDAFIASTLAAGASAAGNASTICGVGAGAACTAAQGLADRARNFDASVRSAYGASPFFPIQGSGTATALTQAAATLSADLLAAGLGGLTVPMAFATDWLTSEGFPLLPTLAGAGIDGAPLRTRQGLWSTGDIEVSALIQVADNLTPGRREGSGGLGYRILAGFLVRLPTGTVENPDVFLDFGTGDAQTDYEGSIIASLTFGSRLGLALGARYGVQGSTVVTKRVAPRSLAMPPVDTRQLLHWNPGAYFGIEIAPSLRLSPELTVTGVYRYFDKDHDVFELLDPGLPFNPGLLIQGSVIKMHQVGGGIRYDTVPRWLSGEAPRPLEIHLRLLHTVSGSGGRTPASTRVEAGIRLFKRFWGPRR